MSLLVIAPTRELAQQIAAECDKVTAFCNPRLECHLAFGGSNKKSYLNRFMKGKPSILVATPGRLLDYLQEDEVRSKFSDIRSVVLDEADTMLDRGFLVEITKILEILPKKEAPQLAGYVLQRDNAPEDRCRPAPRPEEGLLAAVDRVGGRDAHHRYCASVPHRGAGHRGRHSVPVHSARLRGARQPQAEGCHLQLDGSERPAAVRAVRGAKAFLPRELPVYQMHSRMSQPARTKTVNAFKLTDSGLLFASDVVGRGMDFLTSAWWCRRASPMNKEQYVHRVGRTGRAGKDRESGDDHVAGGGPVCEQVQEFPISMSTL